MAQILECVHTREHTMVWYSAVAGLCIQESILILAVLSWFCSLQVHD